MNSILQKIFGFLPDNSTKKITAKNVRDSFALNDAKVNEMYNSFLGMFSDEYAENFLISFNILKNSDFSDGFNNWNKNESFVTDVTNGVLSVDTTGASDPAFYQVIPSLKKGDYSIILKIKNKTGVNQDVRIGSMEEGEKLISIDPNTDYQYIYIDYNVQIDRANSTFLFAPKPNTQFDIEKFFLIRKSGNILTEILEKQNYIDNLGLELNFSNPGISVEKLNTSTVQIIIPNQSYIFDMAGGYRIINAETILVDFEKAAYFSLSKTEYKEVDFSQKGTGETIYIWSERYDAYRSNGLRKNTIGINYYDWVAAWPVFEKSKKNTDVKSWMPAKSTAKSPIYSYLKPFFEKMQLRNKDVTLVSIGDSISTDLNWTDKRPDANERPPFCTEYNVNSYLEEKLRWKEQKYRRFDYAGVFTEILGGGTSIIKETDSNWAIVGGAYLYPITKVIDSGTNAGISFKMPEKIKRLSLIVHSDSQFANQTKVTISGGNGKVELFDGTNWVEANNFTTSFKETQTIPTRTEIRDNAEKRLKFRSLTDLTEKTITVQNVGAGRFGFWGIEYSPKEFMFTYVCASKGSHGIDFLKLYQEWMVDDFKPDLLLQQCCILNQQLGQENRAKSPQEFANDFKVQYESFVAKNYLVLPYILWAATYSYFVDNNGVFLAGKNPNTGLEQTCFDDVNYLSKMYEDKNVPVINLFQRFTDIGLDKSAQEESNIYSAALVGSGKNGNTFTIDGIHLNKLGSDVAFNMINEYFNY